MLNEFDDNHQVDSDDSTGSEYVMQLEHNQEFKQTLNRMMIRQKKKLQTGGKEEVKRPNHQIEDDFKYQGKCIKTKDERRMPRKTFPKPSNKSCQSTLMSHGFSSNNSNASNKNTLFSHGFLKINSK